MAVGATESSAPRVGRPPVTSRAELERLCLDLFSTKGFEATTVDDIAVAAGISRRTFFRYFASKNDVPWGDFDAQLAHMRAFLEARPKNEPVMESLREAVVDFNRFPPDQAVWHRRRMALILGVPTLQAHSTLRFQSWRAVVADFVADRLGIRPTDLLPQAVSHASLGVAIAAYSKWLEAETASLPDLMDTAMRHLVNGFAADLSAAARRGPGQN